MQCLQAGVSGTAAFNLSSTGDLYYVLSKDVWKIHQGKLSWQLSHVCHFHYSLNVNYFSSENPQSLQIQLCDRHEDATAPVSLSLGETNSVGGMIYIVLILCGLKNKTT